MIDPIDRPTIELAGKVYHLKFRLLDLINLERQGFGIRQFSNAENFSIENMLRFAIAAVAHEEVLDFDTVAAQLMPADIPRIADAVTKALEKAQPSTVTRLREPAAAHLTV